MQHDDERAQDHQEKLRKKNTFDRFRNPISDALTAALSFPNPFLMQHDDERAQDHQEKLRKKNTFDRFRNPISDALTVAYALQLFEVAENSFEFCRNNSLHLKTMEEMSKLRKQILKLIFLQKWDHSSFKDVESTWLVYSNKHPLHLNEEELLAQAICAGWADRIAKRITVISGYSNQEGYQSCAADGTVYLDRRSSTSQTAPEFVVYNELLSTNRPYMNGVTAVKSEWLVKYANSLCCFSSPLTDQKPYYEPLSDGVFCWVNPTFGRHNWKLPLHSISIRDKKFRVSVFACALLEGNVLPCLKKCKNLLAATPSTILRPEALGQRRVVDLLNRLMGLRTVDSRAKLKEAWDDNSMFLHLELRNWFQKKFYGEFEKLWEQLLQEAQLEGSELFPKRAKKDRKIAR